MNFNVGQVIKISFLNRKKKETKSIKGKITDIYDKFIIVQFKQYKECFLKKDIEHGLIKVKVA